MFIIFSSFFALAVAQTTDLTVILEGFHNNQGVAQVALFDSPQGFPQDAKYTVYHASVKIIDGSAKAFFPAIPYTHCAVSVLHDEDNNGKMTLGFMGIPKEGFGASRDAEGSFGPPKYSDAVVTLNASVQLLKIKLRYLL